MTILGLPAFLALNHTSAGSVTGASETKTTPSWKLLANLPDHVDCEASLANSARTRECQKADALLEDQPEHVGLLLLAADETTKHDRQLVLSCEQRRIRGNPCLAQHRLDGGMRPLFVRLPFDGQRTLR
jgi:hypothetical protein